MSTSAARKRPRGDAAAEAEEDGRVAAGAAGGGGGSAGPPGSGLASPRPAPGPPAKGGGRGTPPEGDGGNVPDGAAAEEGGAADAVVADADVAADVASAAPPPRAAAAAPRRRWMASAWTDTFDIRLAELREYRDRVGHANYPTQTRGPGRGDLLSAFVTSARARFKRGTLTDAERAALDGVGFEFVGRPTGRPKGRKNRPKAGAGGGGGGDADGGPGASALAHAGGLRAIRWAETFERRLAELREYRDRVGHANYPTQSRGQRGDRLSAFVHTARKRFQRGALTDEEKTALEDVGFEFVGRSGRPRLDGGPPRMKMWGRTAGREDSSSSGVPYGAGAGAPGGAGGANPAVAAASGTGPTAMAGDAPVEASAAAAPVPPSFEEMLYQLVLFKSERGTCDVPRAYAGHRNLGQWAREVREAYLRGGPDAPSDRQVAALRTVGLPLLSHSDRAFGDMLAELRAYREEHGHCVVPVATSGKLGRWVNAQRVAYSAYVTGARSASGYALDQGRVDALNELGFVWSLKERTSWEERFEELKEFRAEHGHTVVPQHYPPNRPLGKWVTKQRYERSLGARGQKSPLTPERIEALNSIGFEWNASKRHTSD